MYWHINLLRSHRFPYMLFRILRMTATDIRDLASVKCLINLKTQSERLTYAQLSCDSTSRTQFCFAYNKQVLLSCKISEERRPCRLSLLFCMVQKIREFILIMSAYLLELVSHLHLSSMCNVNFSQKRRVTSVKIFM